MIRVVEAYGISSLTNLRLVRKMIIESIMY